MYTEDSVKKIKDVKLATVAEDIFGYKPPKGLKFDCPNCNEKEKFTITKTKNIGKCFKCDYGTSSAISLAMKVKNLNYVEGIEFVASAANILLEEEEIVKPAEKKPSAKKSKSSVATTELQEVTPAAAEAPAKKKPQPKEPVFTGRPFRLQQLIDSGLDETDSNFHIKRRDSIEENFHRYVSGTRDNFWNANYAADDLILHYLDLDGGVTQYTLPKRSKQQPFFRVRYQNPALHLDKNNKPKKYDQPPDSQSKLWFPNKLITWYDNGTKFETLYITEGEKKADKMTKHGLPCVGISGIHNLINNKQLPHEFELIVKKCGVKRVVLFLDGDLFDIKAKAGVGVDWRARGFFKAVLVFRDYFAAYRNIGIYLDIFFAHPHISLNAKGADDLLVGPMKEKADSIVDEMKFSFDDANGNGEFVKSYSIATMPDNKIKELWHLQTREKFIIHHKEELKSMPTFQYGMLEYKFNDDGNIEQVSPLSVDEEYWIRTVNENDKVTIKFNYEGAYRFLSRKGGYHNYRNLAGNLELVKVEGKVIKALPGDKPEIEIQNYMLQFTRELQKYDIVQLIHQGKQKYVGTGSLNALPEIDPVFIEREKGRQYLYFKNGAMEVTAEGYKLIPMAELPGFIWEDEIKDFEPKVMAPLITKDEKTGVIDPKASAFECDFFMFLLATSFIDWEVACERAKISPEERTKDSILKAMAHLNDKEQQEMATHLVNKLTGMGYLMHRYRDFTNEKMVIGMDAKESPVGESFGRSGKSLIGTALAHVFPVTPIDGKKSNLEDDPFLFENVTPSTAMVFIDDTKPGIKISRFFAVVTGVMEVNGKNQPKKIIPRDKTPKLYMTTNHNPEASDGSTRDRVFLMAFGDWYNEHHKPMHDFGRAFFQEWDNDQWNLFYNLMANCVSLYLKLGLVECPQQEIIKRQQRQLMGEEFLSWATSYYVHDGKNINIRQAKLEVYENAGAYSKTLKNYMNTTLFMKRLKAFIAYSQLDLNPHKFDKFGKSGAYDKTGSTEYIVVANKHFDQDKMEPWLGSAK